MTTTDTLADRQTPPVIAVDGAYDDVYDTDHPERLALSSLAEEAALAYATHRGAAAARTLRLAFGPKARRAVFNKSVDSEAGVNLELLLVFGDDDRVIWYDRNDDHLWGSRLVAARDEEEAYGGPAVAVLEEETKAAVEALCEGADEAVTDGYLIGALLDLDPTVPGHGAIYDGWIVELDIDDAPARLRRAVGTPAHDDSTGPQRRLLSPAERDVSVRVLHDLDLVRSPAVRVFPGDREVLAEVARVLDPRDRVAPPPYRQPAYISLNRLEELLRNEDGVAHPVTGLVHADKVTDLMELIREAARQY